MARHWLKIVAIGVLSLALQMASSIYWPDMPYYLLVHVLVWIAFIVWLLRELRALLRATR